MPFIILEIYPLKGYQYLLPIAPAVALLAARGLTTWHLPARWDRYTKSIVRPAAIAVVLASLLPGVWSVDVPLGRAPRPWPARAGCPADGRRASGSGANLVPGTELMTIGPSMANILEYYGHRPAQGLSVSTNPLHRNPAYTPIYNPDQSVRDGQFSYLVWDAYSACRSPSTARRLEVLVARYHGVPDPHRAGGRQAGHHHLRGPPVMRRPFRAIVGVCGRAAGRPGHRAAVVARRRTRPSPAARHRRQPSVGQPRGTDPIQHVIVVMQSGHSFDNYFGTRPGVDGDSGATILPAGRRSTPRAA